jgi:carboxymethylenebutenolidase
MRITLSTGTPAELARPESGAPVQGLVLIPDIGGLRPLFDEHCARLANDYDLVVCAPELFPGDEDKPLDWRLDHAGDRTDDVRLADIVAAADATGCERVGVIGFCLGGMLTLKAAGTGRFARAGSFYGMVRVPDNWKNDKTVEPLDAVTAPDACPVIAIIGLNDTWTPPDDVTALEATGATVVRYEDAEHGFAHDASRPTHRADDAADAFTRVMGFINGETVPTVGT